MSNAPVTKGHYLVPAPTPMRTLLADTYEQSHQHLCAVAAKYVGPDAEDVVQDVFVRALQSGDAFDSKPPRPHGSTGSSSTAASTAGAAGARPARSGPVA